MKKKLIKSIIIPLCMVCLLTGCMSRDERKEAKENLNKAKAPAQEYLEEYYPGAKLGNMKTLTAKTFFAYILTISATDFVHAEVTLTDGSDMELLIDSSNGKVLDNYQKESLEESLVDYTRAKVDCEGSKEINVRYQNKNASLQGFAEKNIESVDDLINGEYAIDVTVNYDNSNVDFKNIDISKYFMNSDMTLNFNNYIEGRYKKSEDKPYACSQYLNAEIKESYSDNDSSEPDIKKNYSDNDSSESDIKKNYSDNNSSEFELSKEINTYARETINGIEFVWNSDILDADFKLEEAPEKISTEYYSGATFYTTDSQQVRMNVNNLKGSGGCYVYTFFSGEKEKKQMIVKDEDKYDIWTIEWKKDNHLYRYYNTTKPKASVTFGYYERR